MEKVRIYIDLAVPCDHINGVIGQKFIYGATLDFDVRPMVGEHINIAYTLSEDSPEHDKEILAVIVQIEHIPSAFTTEHSHAVSIDADLVGIDYVRDLRRITELLDQSTIWSGHSIG